MTSSQDRFWIRAAPHVSPMWTDKDDDPMCMLCVEPLSEQEIQEIVQDVVSKEDE